MVPSLPSFCTRVAAALTALSIAQSTGFASLVYDIRATALDGVPLPASLGRGGSK